MVYLACIASYLKLWVADWRAKKSEAHRMFYRHFPRLIFCGVGVVVFWGLKMVFYRIT